MLSDDRGRSMAVVVVNFGACALLQRNLTRVADDLPVPGRVYVVDNWHSAAERAAAQRLAAERTWVFLPQSSNLGFGAGVNVGVARARADGATDLLLLNPDAVIDRTSMAALLEATQTGEVMAAPVIRTPEGRTWFAGLDLYLQDGSIAALHVGDRCAPVRRTSSGCQARASVCRASCGTARVASTRSTSCTGRTSTSRVESWRRGTSHRGGGRSGCT